MCLCVPGDFDLESSGAETLKVESMRKFWNNPNLLLACIVLLGLLLRLPGLHSKPLWYDEAFSVLFSRTGLSGILYGTLSIVDGTAADIHPPLYYGILSGWMNIFGQNAIVVRLLSLVIGIGVILLAWKINTDLFGSPAGLLGALLISISPFQIHYAQEARMYALLSFFLLAATLCLIHGMRKSTLWKWALFGVFCAAGMYTHVLAVFFLFPLALIPILTRKWKIIPYLLGGLCVGLLLYFPWLLNLPAMVSKVEQAYWISKPGFTTVLQVLISFVTDLPLPGGWLPAAVFLTVLVTILGVYRTIAAIRLKLESAKTGAWLAYLAFVPILLTFIVSQWRPVLIPRVMIPAGTIFLLWIAWVIIGTQMPKIVSVITGSVLVLGMILGMWAHYRYDGFPYAPFQEVNQSLETKLSSDGVIVHSNKLSMLPAHYYNPDLPHAYLADPPGSGSDTLAIPTQEVLGLFAEDDIQEITEGRDQVLFVMFTREINEYRLQGLVEHPQLAWLGAQYRELSIETWGDLSIYVFEK